MTVTAEAIYFEASSGFPNSRLPVLAYRSVVVPGGDTAQAFEALFSRHGWPPAWRDTIYPEHHYHSTAHECLGIARGSVAVQLGGESGKTLELNAGDAIVLPAGVAHRKVQGSSDLEVVGAYPPGQRPDMLRGKPGERPAADAALPSWSCQLPIR